MRAPRPGEDAIARDRSFVDFVLDQLAELGDLRERGMFGGWGLYLDGEFFGMIYKGSLYFRTDEATREAYRERGSEPILIGPDPGKNRYWSVPEEVLEEAPLLCEWARAAAATPRGTKRKRKRKRP